MPRYDYRCDPCRQSEEHEFPAGKAPQWVVCARCGRQTAEKQPPSPGAFIIRGFNAKNGYSK